MLVRSLFQLKKLCFKNASHFNNAFHKPTIVGSENKKIRGDKNIVSGRLTQWLIQHWMILKLSETTLKWNKLTCYRDEIGGEQKPFSWSDKLELFGASTAVYKVLLLVPKMKTMRDKVSNSCRKPVERAVQGNRWCFLQAGLIETSVMFIYVHVLRVPCEICNIEQTP